MAVLETLIANFIVSMIVSGLIIYIVTKLLGEKKGIGTALVAAFAGSLIYSLAYLFFGTGLIAAAIGGFVWLVALGGLYKIGWLRSLGIAIVVWLLASAISVFLPTLTGPL